MRLTILITGGAGFIGSHSADEWLGAGHRVRAYDGLVPQVHPEGQRPAYQAAEVEPVRGDVRDPDGLQRLAGWLQPKPQVPIAGRRPVKLEQSRS